MSTDTTHPAVVAPKLTSLAALVAVVVGTMVLVGWAFDIAVLRSILPIWVSMKANAAVCFILIGVSLWLTARQQSAIRNPQSAIFLARFCGLLAGLIGMLTLGEYIFGWNLGIDQWLIREPSGTVGTSHPGRMAPETALDFVLLSVALWLVGGSRQIRKSTRASWTLLAPVSLGLLVTSLALAAMLSYLTPELGAYGWFGFTIMAMHTSMLFVILGMAVIAINWQPDILQWSLGSRATAAFACGMALLVFVGLNTSRSQFWMNETNRQISHTEKMLVDADNIQVGIIDAQVHNRDYFITGDEKFLKLYLLAKADSQAKLDELYRTEFASGEAEHQQHFTRIEAQIKVQFQWLQQIIDARRTGINEAARSNMLSHGEDLLESLRSTFAQNKSEDLQILEQLKRESISVVRFSYLSTFIGTLASLLIFLAVLFRLNSATNERKQNEDTLNAMTGKLRDSQQLLDSIVEHIPIMVFVKRASDLCFELFNHAGEKLLGYSRNDLLGKGNYDFWPREQGDWFTAADRKVLASHEVTEIPEEPIKTASGETRYLHTWKVGLRDEGGEPAHLLGISIDITERKLAEAKLAEQVDELQRWHNATSGREGRILDLKHEINELLVQAGQPPRYPSAESQNQTEK